VKAANLRHAVYLSHCPFTIHHSLNLMTIDAYLKRIRYDGPVGPTREVLKGLHRAQMFSVPFENLDILLGVPIELNLGKLYEKVVENRRGGFCYELNGLFGWLLKEIGFEIEMLEARVFGEEGEPGPHFDHMLLRVGGDQIADVGFGDSFTEPMQFGYGEQKQQTGLFKLVENGERWELRRNNGDGWKPQYDFSLVSRDLDEYEPMCRHQQTSPDSIFTKKKVCSLATPNGRITYANGRLIETDGASKSERMIGNKAELEGVLEENFGVVLEGDLGKLF